MTDRERAQVAASLLRQIIRLTQPLEFQQADTKLWAALELFESMARMLTEEDSDDIRPV